MVLQDIIWKFRDAVGWRYDRFMGWVDRRYLSHSPEWVRLIMDQETDRFVRSLNYRSLDAAEVSGLKWQHFGFASYKSLNYPDFDVCLPPPTGLPAFDIIIIEQVLEHVYRPFRAVRTLHAMLRPGGWLIVTAPFLMRVHNTPVDCSRWTPLGLKYLLAEGGFSIDSIETGAWGNRYCARASYRRIPRYIPALHSLTNDPIYPLVVWAFAKK